MGIGILGADSNIGASHTFNGNTLFAIVTSTFGAPPQFWGRYFKAPGNADPVQYQAASESPFMTANNLSLLPFARQTTSVGGSKQQGQNDAISNAEAYIQALTVPRLAAQGGNGSDGIAGQEFLVFLDVEPETPLSQTYFDGWASKLITHSQAISGGQITLLPCVYMNYSDTQTSAALMNADAEGVKCYGVSVARYFTSNPFSARGWNDTTVGPSGEIPCATVMWQFFGDLDQYIDGNQINPDPAISAFVTARLAIP